ncbi:MAG: hypothetical protein HW378_3654 [Anaerolineales bacterium]|nr:hypothetical protein [Anaerolineales bacterium]
MSGSPFPGMDPYLEGDLWQEFHDRLANQISEQLLPQLQPKYVALLNKRYVINPSLFGIAALPPERTIYPDVHVARPPQLKETTEVVYGVTPPTLEVVNPLPEEMPLLNIEIRDVAERRLVTVIEILSPVNKRGSGLRDDVEKRTALLQTQTHLLEIDLLRQGARIPFIGELPPAPYYIFLSRFPHRPRTSVWTIRLHDRLPVVPVPLLPPDPDVPLDLQAAVNACFDLVGYERLLDYAQPPPPPELSAEDLVWVRSRIETVQATPANSSV